MLNRKSRNLKDLGVDPDAMSDVELAKLISDNPKTMTRPLYLLDDKLIVGFREAELDSLLGVS